MYGVIRVCFWHIFAVPGGDEDGGATGLFSCLDVGDVVPYHGAVFWEEMVVFHCG